MGRLLNEYKRRDHQSLTSLVEGRRPFFTTPRRRFARAFVTVIQNSSVLSAVDTPVLSKYLHQPKNAAFSVAPNEIVFNLAAASHGDRQFYVTNFV